MGIKEKIIELEFIKNCILVRKFGKNIHDVDLWETVQTGIVNRLLIARALDIDYAVVVSGVIPSGKSWDKYGDGTWNPRRSYISTDDIKTDDYNKEQEERNIYDFLRGKESTKTLPQQTTQKVKQK